MSIQLCKIYNISIVFDVVFMLADLSHLNILIRYSCSLMDNICNFTTPKESFKRRFSDM